MDAKDLRDLVRFDEDGPHHEDLFESITADVKWLVAGPEIERLAARGEPVAFLDYPPAKTGTDDDWETF